MKCTDCGQLVRPVVAVDIDGTLGDYHSHFIDFLVGYVGHERRDWGEAAYKGDKMFKAWVMEQWGIDERTWNDCKLAYRQGAQKRTMPIYAGAARLCGAVRSAGAELWLTTTRPYLRLDNIDPDTRFWLGRHHIPWDHLLYDPDKYELLTKHVDKERVVAVVDDQIEQILEAEKVFGPDIAIMKISPWNMAYRSQGVGRLEDIEADILNRVRKWRNDNE
jgi:hypothetical protein